MVTLDDDILVARTGRRDKVLWHTLNLTYLFDITHMSQKIVTVCFQSALYTKKSVVGDVSVNLLHLVLHVSHLTKLILVSKTQTILC